VQIDERSDPRRENVCHEVLFDRKSDGRRIRPLDPPVETAATLVPRVPPVVRHRVFQRQPASLAVAAAAVGRTTSFALRNANAGKTAC
jgi:hypothetical protein